MTYTIRIGVDIDDTLNNSSIKEYNYYARIFCEQNNLECNPDYSKWNTGERYNWDKKTYYKFMRLYREKIDFSAEISTQAINALKQLFDNKDINFIIYIVSARDDLFHSSNVHEKTRKYLKASNVPFHHLITHAGDKVLACNKHQLDYFIDDKFEHCYNLAINTRAKIFMISNIYNQDYSSTKISKVKSIKEFCELVLQDCSKKLEKT